MLIRFRLLQSNIIRMTSNRAGIMMFRGHIGVYCFSHYPQNDDIYVELVRINCASVLRKIAICNPSLMNDSPRQ